MKNFLAIVLAAVLLFSIVGCTQGVTSDTSNTTTTASSGTDATDVTETGAESQASDGSGTESTTITAKTSSSKKPSGSAAKPSINPDIDNTKLDIKPPNINLSGKTVKLLTVNNSETDLTRWKNDFKKFYKGTLSVQSVDWNSLPTTLNTQVMANTPPDVVLLRQQDYPSLASSGILMDLKGKIDYSSPLWKGTKAVNESIVIKGKHYYTISSTFPGYFIWFNKNIFTDNGMQTPEQLYDKGKWDWTALIKAAKELTFVEDGKTTQYGFSAKYDMLALCLLGSRKADLIKFDNNGNFVNNITDSKLADVYNTIFDMYMKDKSVAPADQAQAIFTKNKAAMYLDGTWMAQQEIFNGPLKQGKYGIVPFPKYPGMDLSYMHGVQMMAIPKNSKNVNGALAYINMLRYYSVSKDENEQQKKISLGYGYTEKQLGYMDQAGKVPFLVQAQGLPEAGSLFGMAMRSAYGATWTQIMTEFKPIYQQYVDDMNKAFSK